MSNVKSFLIGVALSSILIVIGFAAVQSRFSPSLLFKGLPSDLQVSSDLNGTATFHKQTYFQNNEGIGPFIQTKANMQIQTHNYAPPLEELASQSGLRVANRNNELSIIKSKNNDSIELVSMKIIEHGPLDSIDKDTPVIGQVYVSKIRGAYGMYEPRDYDDYEAIHYNYGKALDVIKLVVTDNGVWYAIKEKYSNLRRDDDNDGVIETLNYQGYEWVTLYVKDNDAKTTLDLTLDNKQLSTISYLVINENYDDAQYHLQSIPEGYMTFEIIDAKLYENKKREAVNFVTNSNVYSHKQKGELTIALKDSSESLKLTDISIDENTDGMATYTYKGYIKDLNQHLVYGEYFEMADYKMFDMSTGELTQSFIEYPHISPDKSYIIAVYANPYEVVGELELFKIEDSKIVPIISIGLPYWLPTYNQQDIFWANDGFLYLPVNHATEFWDDTGDYNSSFQYIRIKVE